MGLVMPYPEYFNWKNPLDDQWVRTVLREDEEAGFQALMNLAYAYAHAEGKTAHSKRVPTGGKNLNLISTRWRGLQDFLFDLGELRRTVHG